MKTSCKTRWCLTAVTIILGIAMLGSGCGTCKPGSKPPGKYEIEVSLDPSLQKGSVLVDLVGVNAATLPSWMSYSMTDYWKGDDPRRMDSESDRTTLDFTSGKPATQSLALTDPRWEKWKGRGVTHVLVLADLPGVHPDKPGTQDARRQVLPLDPCHWAKKTKKLSVSVKQTIIDVLTPLREVK